MRGRVRLRRGSPCARPGSLFFLFLQPPRLASSRRGGCGLLRALPGLSFDSLQFLPRPVVCELPFRPFSRYVRAAAENCILTELARVGIAVRKESARDDIEERVQRLAQFLIGAFALETRAAAARCRKKISGSRHATADQLFDRPCINRMLDLRSAHEHSAAIELVRAARLVIPHMPLVRGFVVIDAIDPPAKLDRGAAAEGESERSVVV